MKVTVSKYLNVRVGAPRVNAPCYQYLAPGTVLEVDGKLYQGDPFNDNTTWYKDLAGNYYWSGGVFASDVDIEKDLILDGKVDFRSLVKLKNWSFRQLDPQNPSKVKIAVLDSGIYKDHPDFGSIATFLQNSKNEPIEDDTNYVDERGHGSKVAGIIAGRNNDAVGIHGICPDSTLLSIKTLNEKGKANSVSVKNGLNELSKHNQIKIANLSFSLPKNAYDKISDSFDKVARSKVLVAAAGNEHILRFGLRSPSNNPNIVSVASLPMKNLLDPNLIFPQGLDYVIPKFEKISTSNDPDNLYDTCEGSSFATPIITGLLTELSLMNINVGSKANAVAALDKHCYSLDEFRLLFKNLKTFRDGLPIIKTP